MPSPQESLAELAETLASREPLDAPHCRRLALKVTGAIENPQTAAWLHDAICAIIEAHGDDPEHASDRFDFLAPTIEGLIVRPAPRPA